MKRSLLILLSVITVFCCTEFSIAEPYANASETEPSLNARHAIVVEKTSGRILFEKAAYEKTAMASTTKLMTALIVASEADMSSTTTVSQKAASIGGSVAELKKGEEISIKDLMYCLMLRSGNDAAIALAEAVSGSVDAFCVLMNEKAKELGALNTNFTSPHGLDNENHYTTAYDLAIICRAAADNAIVSEIMGTKHYTFGNRFLINTNPFLGVTDGITGGKTGFTNNAGRCIALTANRNDMEVVIILIGCTDSKTRFSDGSKLTEYIYGNYKMVDVLSQDTTVAVIGNNKNIFQDAEVKTKKSVVLPLREQEAAELMLSLNLDGNVYSYKNKPLAIRTENEFSGGSIVGELNVITTENETLISIDCQIMTAVVEKDFWYYFKKIVVCWFCGVV